MQSFPMDEKLLVLMNREWTGPLADRFPGFETPISATAWPEFDPALLIESEIEIALQVNGKVRDRLTVPREAGREAVERLALESPRVREFLAGLTVRKVIVVPGKLVNVVAN